MGQILKYSVVALSWGVIFGKILSKIYVLLKKLNLLVFSDLERLHQLKFA